MQALIAEPLQDHIPPKMVTVDKSGCIMEHLTCETMKLLVKKSCSNHHQNEDLDSNQAGHEERVK